MTLQKVKSVSKLPIIHYLFLACVTRMCRDWPLKNCPDPEPYAPPIDSHSVVTAQVVCESAILNGSCTSSSVRKATVVSRFLLSASTIKMLRSCCR